MCVSIQGKERLVGLFSIYVFNVACAQASFWTSIIDALPIVDSWFAGGDFKNASCVNFGYPQDHIYFLNREK